MYRKISADMLYNYIKCPHRLYLDIFEDPSKRDPESAFMKLLWEKGIDFEKQVISEFKKTFLDLSHYKDLEKEKRTLEALNNSVGLIYNGRISTDNLVGEPDLLVRKNDEYVAGDIKSGSGLEGENDLSEGKPKLHYAVQLCVYTDILEQKGFSKSRTPFIHDIHGREIYYDLNSPVGKRNSNSLWDAYQEALLNIQKIIEQNLVTTSAHSNVCKLCHWRSYCLRNLIQKKDLSLIPELGRKKRDILNRKIKNLFDFARKPLTTFISGKKTIFPGIGSPTLKKYYARAILLSDTDKGAYIKRRINFPKSDIELFFDIETDPMHDFCYLHGFIECHNENPSSEKYIAFFADNPTEKEEERIFVDAWHYIKQHFPCAVYYYSPYEKIIWKKLCRKYSELIDLSELEVFFDSPYVVDLYSDVVKKYTEWPTYSYSVKDLAKYLGFRWRDESPSGAESIEWFHRWIESGNPAIKHRILQYNEDDCVAMKVLLERIKRLPVKNLTRLPK